MAVDYFLKVDGIKGESRDDKHRDELEILSFSFGESNDGDALRAQPGALDMQDFHFVAPVTRASPPIFLAVATGNHYKEAILTARKAGQVQAEFLKWTLTDVIFTSYQEGGSAGAETVPLDQFSINFAKVEIEYKVQNADGSFGETVKAGWERKK